MLKSAKFLCSLSFALLINAVSLAQCTDYPFAREGVGDERDEGHGVAVDPFGNVFFGGWFDSDSISFAGGAAANTSIGQNGNGDVFIARYRADGTLSWVTSAGGIDNSDWCWDIAAGPDGSVFGTGEFYSTTMDFGGGVTINKSGLSDAWIAKWDSSGVCLWARSFGAGDSDQGFGVDVDASGNSYITGTFGQTIIHGSSTIVENAGDDVFVAVYDPNGTPLWALSAGGPAFDGGQEIAVAADGRIYVAGRSFGDMSFAGSSWTNAGLSDLFLLAWTPTGTEDWMFNAGGLDSEEAWDVDVHPDGSVVIGGSHWSSPLNFGGTSLSSAGEWDALLARFESDGTLQWARSVGGADSDRLYGLAVGPDGTIYTGGQWGDGAASFDGIVLNEQGIFTAVWDDAGTAIQAESFGGTLTQFDIIWSAAAGSAGGFYGGEFTTSSIDFGGGEVINNGPGGGFDSDVFVVAQRSPAGITVNEPISGDSLCEGSDFSLTLSTSLDVQWYRDGVLLAGETGSTLNLTSVSLADAGGYYAWVGDGCDSATTDTAELLVLEFPSAPVLALSAGGDTIFAAHDGASITWAVDGTVDLSLVGDTIVPVTEGVYTAVALNSLGGISCASGLSNEVQVSFSTGLDQLLQSIRVYPNPVTDGVLIVEGASGSWMLSDLTGRIVTSGSFHSGVERKRLDLGLVKSGTYMFKGKGLKPISLVIISK